MMNYFLLTRGRSLYFEKISSKECKIGLVKVNKQTNKSLKLQIVLFSALLGVHVRSAPAAPAVVFPWLLQFMGTEVSSLF